MNYVLKTTLEKALTNPHSDKYKIPLDIILTKLIVIPLQRAWSKMTSEEKRKFSEKAKTLIRKRNCIDCRELFILTSKRHSERGQCVDCYYMDKYRFDS